MYYSSSSSSKSINIFKMVNNYEIISKEPVSGTEVLDIINEKGKNRELTYREEKVKEYLEKRVKLDSKKFNEAKKELEELEIPRISEAHIIKILEIMPKNGVEIRSIVSHSGTIIVDESTEKILAVLKKYN
jgi:DNA-directed RNA polymerase subunit F